jgi:hypothetical protein
MHVLTRRDDAGAARCKADSGIRFVEREALGTAKAEEGRMIAALPGNLGTFLW